MTTTFDDTLHQYRIDGRVVPSVTQIVKAAGLINADWYTPASAEIGTALHYAIALHQAGDLDPDSIDPIIAPALEAWKQFVRDSGARILASEVIVTNETLQYAGRIDSRAIINGRQAILDVKSGAKERWHGIQLALYAMCFTEHHDRYAVYLKGGKLRVEQYEDEDDYAVAHAVVTLAQWKGRT